MQPTTEFTDQLFHSQPDRIEQHFFGHVVASEAVLPIVVSTGPKNSSFLFNFANRNNKTMVSSLINHFYQQITSKQERITPKIYLFHLIY